MSWHYLLVNIRVFSKTPVLSSMVSLHYTNPYCVSVSSVFIRAAQVHCGCT